jgi:hypothetical protein
VTLLPGICLTKGLRGTPWASLRTPQRSTAIGAPVRQYDRLPATLILPYARHQHPVDDSAYHEQGSFSLEYAPNRRPHRGRGTHLLFKQEGSHPVLFALTSNKWLPFTLRLPLICQHHGIPLRKPMGDAARFLMLDSCSVETRRAPDLFGIAVATCVDVPRTL